MTVLTDLASRSRSREELQAKGYRPVAKSADLFRHGYSVVWWIKPGVKESEVIEYVPRHTWQTSSILPRITIECYDDQVRLHRALGLGIVGPGEKWNRREDATPGLFDHLV